MAETWRYSRYRLQRKNPQQWGDQKSFTQGFLFELGSGLARTWVELTPWESLGDPSMDVIEAELNSKGTRSTLPLLQSTFACARTLIGKESKTRESRPIESHATVLDLESLNISEILELRRAGFSTIKIKCSCATNLEADQLAAKLGSLVGHWGDLRLRLDFNCRGNLKSLLRFVNALPVLILDRIDFFEDPMPFEVETWGELALQTQIALVLDRGYENLEKSQLFDLLQKKILAGIVHKPGLGNFELAKAVADAHGRVIVTSLLGHMVGQWNAACQARALAANEVHGFLTHTHYKLDASWSKIMKTAGPGLLNECPSQEAEDALQSYLWNPLK